MNVPPKDGVDFLIDVINLLPSPVYIKNENHVWVEVNSAFCEFIGIPREHLIGKTDFELSSSERAKAFWKINNAVFETKKTRSDIIKMPMRNGDVKWMESVKSYYQDRSGKGYIIGILTDITELKKREAALIKAEKKAFAASQAKSDFLANMSHEIRTPMNGVLGMAQILKGAELTGMQSECVDVIMRSGEALVTIINDILDFSKIEAGKFEFVEEAFDLKEAVEDVVALLGVTANEKLIELILDFQNPSNRLVLGDKGRIRQVLTNLIGNAIKFTPEGSVLVKIRMADRADRLCVTIDIEDTGIGIAEDQIEKIFDKFSQADNSRTREYGGTGLGLTITKSLVEAMQGSIRAESVLGEGTKVTIKVGLKAGGYIEEVSSEALNKASEKILSEKIPSDSRVLIVDDLEQNLGVLEGLLNKFGIKPDRATSVKEAIRKIKQVRAEKSQYDLLITDYHMPEVNGFDFVKALRQVSIFDDLKILVLSSVNSDELHNQFSKIENCTYHQKPVRLSHLEASIQKNLVPQTPVKMATETIALPPKNSSMPSKRILIAEDDVTNQLVLKRMLEGMGYEFDVASNGHVACQLVQASQYDLILMDISMPVMDGVTALKRIREMERGGDYTPIIAVTAHAMKSEEQRFIKMGFDDYIPKPIFADVLKEVVARSLAPYESPYESMSHRRAS
ncbi:PAS domain-containing hybrid sensor histidine kinase/response regulator [Litorimonas taeanensis]|nr:response regulator [Litorimonas taeanensis]